MRKVLYPLQASLVRGSPVKGVFLREGAKLLFHHFLGVMACVHFEPGWPPREEEVGIWGEGIPVHGDFPDFGLKEAYGLSGESQVVQEGRG
ncbi:hypothetical protein [Thermus caldilimi]|uniref:hypothetical protein n=1 Tax=Thermus caldilimi TaxID=2483360 RepID=UPI0010763DAD|nr:hypothetical protein [Thermus caldilimi]